MDHARTALGIDLRCYQVVRSCRRCSMSSPSAPDARTAMFVEALERTLQTPEITSAAHGLMSMDELRPTLEQQQRADVWVTVDAELARWEQRSNERKTIQNELIEQFSRPIFAPRGIRETVRAFFVDKKPAAIRLRMERLL